MKIMKPYAAEFIMWALTHAKRESIPAGAELPLPAAECGAEPWHYLFGTSKTHTSRYVIEERWENFYSKNGWSRAQYDYATKDMQPNDYATDCGGLLDAYLSETVGRTDKTSNIYYGECTDKGKIKTVTRPYRLGEPVFKAKSSGKMHHIGFICGFLDGEPLVVEARGLSYGVVVTRFAGHGWTHRGLLTGYFEYGEAAAPAEEAPKTPAVFALESPMMRGEAVRALQIMLNAAGCRDADGNALAADGKLGEKTYAAFLDFLRAHRALIAAEPAPPESIIVTQEIYNEIYTGKLIRRQN